MCDSGIHASEKDASALNQAMCSGCLPKSHYPPHQADAYLQSYCLVLHVAQGAHGRACANAVLIFFWPPIPLKPMISFSDLQFERLQAVAEANKREQQYYIQKQQQLQAEIEQVHEC